MIRPGFESRPVSPEAYSGEDKLDQAFRPRRFEDFTGQRRVVENLRLAIAAVRKRADGGALDHVLLSGPPGLGKTTLAAIVAAELGVQMQATSGPVLEKAGDIAGILTQLDAGDVLFIDEVHRLPRPVEEVLYTAMEDYAIDIVLGQGPTARTVKLTLKPFTLIAATTRAGLISAPLRARFGLTHRLEHYDLAEMEAIVARASGFLRLAAEPDGIRELAGRSRGTPRIAIRLLRRVRDYVQVRGDGTLTAAAVHAALELLEVDPLGLDGMDRRILAAIVEKFEGGPVGIDSLAVAVGEEAGTIEEVYEPYLIQVGMLKRTPRGRVATARAFDYLGSSRRP